MKAPLNVLQKYWNYTKFRPLQEDIIQNILENRDTLALLPTGGGKSICFQVPALCLEGICLVISPLIALMKDQVQQLKTRNIPADAIHGGLSIRDIDRIFDNAVYGHLKVLYLSPERLKTPLAMERIRKMPISFFAVDEAHCISQWGYDFRPAYLEIAEIRKLHPQKPILALTATATNNVASDIKEKLAFDPKGSKHFQKSFARENIHFSVLERSVKETTLLELLKRYSGSAIVYVRNRGKTVQIANYLQRRGHSADFYHAGLSPEERTKKQENWISDRKPIIVSTNAFGMGIDKSNVRLVVHMDLPDSLEAYYQEAGRAGRDGKIAHAVLLFNQQDRKKLIDHHKISFPNLEVIRKAYQALGHFYHLAYGSGKDEQFDFDLYALSEKSSLSMITLHHALSWLQKNDYIFISDLVSGKERIYIPHPNKIYDQAPKLHAELIRTIFRIHEGVGSYFVHLKIDQLARWMQLSQEKCRSILERLHRQHLVHYENKGSGMRITFLEERLKAESVRIDSKVYQSLKTMSWERIHGAIQYAEKRECRMKQILFYFDEISKKNCGHCDVCVQENTTEDMIRKKVEANMSKTPIEIQEILHQFDPGLRELVLDVLEKMIDGRLLRKHENTILNW